ncbi:MULTISPECIES: lipopolysaccharide biosynthesis protein [unclassified Ensifer]|uniref:lipopolysaccharide biosynthesis protein n=1 Tax=unclassified Ensifer TaxID=2633371 RepID=UPI001FEE664C|nr:MULTISPECIES: lipopolysaccharide biosynthesis protein [unclassified Ensifer]
MTSDRRGLAARSAIGLMWTGLSMGGLAVAELVALIVLARLLAPSEFGLYAAALVVINFSAIFEGLGVAQAIVQRPVVEESHLRVGFTLSLIFSLSMAGLVWWAAPTIADLFRLTELAPVVRAACAVFLCRGISMVAQASAQRALRFRWLAGIEAGAFAIGFVLVGPLLAWRGLGIWALIGALVCQHFVRMLALLIGQPHPKRLLLERRAIGHLLYFGGGFTIARIFNYLAGQADKAVVGRWLGAESLGLYALASQLMTAPAVIVGQTLDMVLFPTMALIQQEPARLARAFRGAVASCALLVLPASVVVMAVLPELVQVLLGPGWENAVLPLQILAAGMLFRTSYKLSDSITRATGAVYARAWRQAVFAFAVGAGSFIGQHWGVTGVALGAVIAVASNFLLMAQLSLRLTGLKWSDFAVAHLPGVALAVTVGGGAWMFANLLRELHTPPLSLLGMIVLTTAPASALLCWCAPALFLGHDGRSALQVLMSLAPAWLQRRPT